MPYLIVREPERVAFSIPLQPLFRVGRQPENELVLTDRHVSRHHIELSLQDQQCSLVDLGSRHGTLVNGQPAERRLLHEGDRIEIGRVVLTYCEDADPPHIVHQQPSTVETIAPMPEDSDWRRLRLFYQLGRALESIGDSEALVRDILRAVVDALDCTRGLIGISEQGRAAVRKVSWARGDSEEEVVVSDAILDSILNRREALIAQESRTSKTSFSAIGTPLQLGSRLMGFIYLEDRRRAARFAPDDLHFLNALSSLIAAALDNAERLRRATAAVEALRDPAEELIGQSAPMKSLRAQIRRYASAPSAHVLIQGESGTGKELVARTLHALSSRSEYPFVAVNCAALPETMIESELFGYDKGAFTGALKSNRGKFLLAHRGTLFLDEIGDLSLAAQAKVLRAIEDGEIQPLGSDKTLRVDVRIISATHKDLLHEIAENRFREDLFYRLNGLVLHLEPLRARGDDVVVLAQAFLTRAESRVGKRFSGFTDRALDVIRRYYWPGNIRELRNEIERAAILSDLELIDDSDLSPRLTARSPTMENGQPPSMAEQFARLNYTERALVEGAMAKAGGNVSEAARLLGISRIMMKRRLDRYGLDTEHTQ
jgi:Nif-specific regulatory protein